MTKLRLSKKAIAIIVAIAVIVIAAGCFGATYGILHRKLKTPDAKVVSVNAEPSYTIEIAWEKVSGAKFYTVEYKYDLYPDVVHSATEIANTSLIIKMVKGNLQFRIKALGNYLSNTSDFSEWQNYYVEPLVLDTFRGFNFKYVEGDGYQIDMDTFYPITYTYKGTVYAVNYYEIDALNKDELRGEDELQPQAVSLTQLENGLSFKLPSGSGEWNFYVRPVLYVEINGVKDYTQAEGLYELYDENISYTKIQLIVS